MSVRLLQRADVGLLRAVEFFFGPRDTWGWWRRLVDKHYGPQDWDGFGTCEICGKRRAVNHHGWHDEGSPMLTCRDCGVSA